MPLALLPSLRKTQSHWYLSCAVCENPPIRKGAGTRSPGLENMVGVAVFSFVA